MLSSRIILLFMWVSTMLNTIPELEQEMAKANIHLEQAIKEGNREMINNLDVYMADLNWEIMQRLIDA